MNALLKMLVVLVIVLGTGVGMCQAQGNSFPMKYDSKPVGELMALELRVEQGVEGFATVGLLGLGHFIDRFGVRIQLMRYTEFLTSSSNFPPTRPFVEWAPIRISYIPYFKRGKYTKGWSSMENEPFFIWKSVTPNEYAKMYIRLFAETSYIKIRDIKKKYPFVLTGGVQLSYGLVSIEGGYKYQTKKWYEFVKPGNYLITKPFSFTGPYVTANITIGGILTRTTPRKSE
jgi:hypothetical protein